MNMRIGIGIGIVGPGLMGLGLCHAAAAAGLRAMPFSIEFRADPLPVTPVGKVRKNVLRDPYWVGHERKI
ncbi:hypothetical protein [Variovorax sp. YR216]|uniref:hypothetical protein n=1 Tax=Variovorax sp. YR216 TaxID=1882828 RepID=UPI00089CAD24|nr:hypothetical protein [Variovorax sp. YR216]SEB21990.1 hypothetical protein SAMN05444680_115113 [Variovorax sp. YR216]